MRIIILFAFALALCTLNSGCGSESRMTEMNDPINVNKHAQNDAPSIKGKWKDDSGWTWIFEASGHFECDFLIRGIKNISHGSYRVAGNRLLLEWLGYSGGARTVPTELKKQNFEIEFLDNDTVALTTKSSGWMGGKDDWQEKNPILERVHD